MPVLVRAQRLHEAGILLRLRLVAADEEVRAGEHAVHVRRANGGRRGHRWYGWSVHCAIYLVRLFATAQDEHGFNQLRRVSAPSGTEVSSKLGDHLRFALDVELARGRHPAAEGSVGRKGGVAVATNTYIDSFRSCPLMFSGSGWQLNSSPHHRQE